MVIVVVEILVKEIWLEKQITEKGQDEQDAEIANRQLVAIGARCGCWKLLCAIVSTPGLLGGIASSLGQTGNED